MSVGTDRSPATQDIAHPAAGPVTRGVPGSAGSVALSGQDGYAAFLASKRRAVAAVGVDVDPGELAPVLHPFQRDAVTWAIGRGRAALWEDTGLGKTLQLLEWARHSAGPHGRALIVAPLAVCQQTIREAATKLDLEVRYAPDGDAVGDHGLWITNPERLERMPAGAELDAAVLDEASILRDSSGTTRTRLIEHFAATPRRLACTATPAPNQAEELTNQCEFVGVMSRVDMLASYFVHEGNTWRPKGHAYGPMAQWMSQWALALRRPSDLGYPDDGYELAGLDIVPEVVEVDVAAEGQLFATDLGGLGGRARTRRETLTARVARAVELVEAEPGEPSLLWCALNDEATALARALPGAVNVHGAMSPEEKSEALLAFADGGLQTLITKPSIAGRGLNLQRCARMAFVGLGDSFEDYYQCIRRAYRYGQTRRVRAHVVVSELEQQVTANVARKQREHEQQMERLVRAMQRARAAEPA